MSGIIIFWHLIFGLVGALVGILIGRRIERRSKPPFQTGVPAEKPAVETDPGILKAGRTSDGKLWLEMNGKHIGDQTALDPNLRESLLNLILELRPWLETEKTPLPAFVTDPVAALVTAAAPPPPVPVAPKAPKKEAPVAPVMKSIIEQVDDVLQARLAKTDLKDRGIQLIEGPNGSVVVQDGLNRYEGLEAVPDAEITSLIRAAISEWEKSTK
jgi:hypothetical protein